MSYYNTFISRIRIVLVVKNINNETQAMNRLHEHCKKLIRNIHWNTTRQLQRLANLVGTPLDDILNNNKTVQDHEGNDIDIKYRALLDAANVAANNPIKGYCEQVEKILHDWNAIKLATEEHVEQMKPHIETILALQRERESKNMDKRILKITQEQSLHSFPCNNNPHNVIINMDITRHVMPFINSTLVILTLRLVSRDLFLFVHSNWTLWPILKRIPTLWSTYHKEDANLLPWLRFALVYVMHHKSTSVLDRDALFLLYREYRIDILRASIIADKQARVKAFQDAQYKFIKRTINRIPSNLLPKEIYLERRENVAPDEIYKKRIESIKVRDTALGDMITAVLDYCYIGQNSIIGIYKNQQVQCFNESIIRRVQFNETHLVHSFMQYDITFSNRILVFHISIEYVPLSSLLMSFKLSLLKELNKIVEVCHDMNVEEQEEQDKLLGEKMVSEYPFVLKIIETRNIIEITKLTNPKDNNQCYLSVTPDVGECSASDFLDARHWFCYYDYQKQEFVNNM
jgi:hypothetical protein